MDGIPPIDPLDLEQFARAKEPDYTHDRSGWVERRMHANLLVLGLLLVAGVILFLLTR